MSTLLDSAKLEVQQHLHTIHVLPIAIVYLNNVCDSRCLTCSIWKNNHALRIPADRQMTDELLAEVSLQLQRWHPRQILISGGEPLMHPRFSGTVRRFAAIASKVCTITNGLLLKSIDRDALERVSEFYVSFDAPDKEGYEHIRGVDGFERLTDGIAILASLPRPPRIVARCTLQHDNVRRIPELIASARQIGFDSISFLGVDVSSAAFARDVHGAGDILSVAPTPEDLAAMESGIKTVEKSQDSFVEGGAERLKRIVQYFRALIGTAEFPPVHCNAPWVSIVIETTGKIRGCFFQPVIGSFRDINSEAAVKFRRALNVDTDATCQRCVCSKMLGIQDFIRL
jgi:Fe-coproporphyrin III synthase